MPNLSELQIYDRLCGRLEELKAGKSIETRTLSKLLTDQQSTALKAAIADGKATGQRVRSVQISFFEEVVKAMNADMGNIADRMIADVTLDSAKVYMDAYTQALKNRKNPETEANAALTRRKFKRNDGMNYSTALNARDIAVKEIEEQIKKQIEAQLTDAEREELEWNRQVLAEMKNKKKK